MVTWQAIASNGYKVETRLDSCSGYKRGKLLLKQRREQLLAIQIEHFEALMK